VGCGAPEDRALAHVRIDRGDAPVKAWLESPDRRTVNAEQVVFDPSGTCGEECINLFNGMPVQAVRGGIVRKAHRAAAHLCGEADSDMGPASDWVLKWLAYPLQHPARRWRARS
jgi:putative DNA primase/helicase